MVRITSGRLALAVSTLSLVVVTGGVTYAAATIGTAQLKNNAVTSPKIKNNSVTGQDVKESSLGAVPSAVNAGQASNSGAVDGMSVAKVVYRSASVATPVIVFNGGGLVISASCPGDDLALNATTSKASSSIYSSLVDLEGDALQGNDQENLSFGIATTFDLLGGASLGEEDPALVTFVYLAADNTVATGTLATDHNNCQVSGTVTFG